MPNERDAVFRVAQPVVDDARQTAEGVAIGCLFGVS